jgi:antibiotic biosynthesis monooxygenase (ABM) superfamily enzyme
MDPHVKQVATALPDRAAKLRAESAGAKPREPPRPPASPPRHKLALVSWAAAYPVITAILATLGPTLASWPLVLRTLLLSVLMVTSLTWLIMPAMTRLFRPWLTPST